jgi:outer membrane receptor protein involved in Fe transport
MRSPNTRIVVMLLLTVAVPALCFGANVGKIAGTVLDKETGQPLGFPQVIIVGTAMGAMGLADGSFAILNVPPGTYDVRATYMGYKSVQVNGVAVKPDLTENLEFQLEKTVVSELEPVIIQAERPVVQVDVTSTRNIFTAGEVQSLPVDNPVNVINFVSGTTVDARGSHIRGGRETEVGYYVDNSPIQDPIQSNSVVSLSTQAVTEMVVFTGGFNAEYGNASSGIVNIITSEGSDKFEGSVEHRMYLPLEEFWQRGDAGDQLDTGESRERINLMGPIYKQDNTDLRYAVAFEGSNWDDYDAHVRTEDRPGRQRLYDGTLTYRFGRSKIKAVANVENSKYVSSFDSYRLYERILVPKTWRTTTDDNYRLGISGSHMINDRSFVDASFSVLDASYNRAQTGKKWDLDAPIAENQARYNWNLDVQRNEDNFIISGDNPYYDHQEKRIYSFRGSYTVQKGRNEVRSGLDLNLYDVQNDDVFASTQNYYLYRFDVQPTAGAVYVQDKLEFQGMIMNLGGRVDFFDPNHKTYKDYNHPYDPSLEKETYWHGPDYDEAPIEIASYDTAGNYLGGGLVDATVKWKFSPRLGVSHPITENSYLHFLYGHFFQMPSFNYLYQNERFHTRGRWYSVGNPDLEAEKTVAYEVGVNHLLSSNTAVDLTFFYKDITDMTETVVRGPLAESNPQSRSNYVTYMNSGYGNVRGFEINLKRPLFRNWHYHAAYTFMVAKGFSSDVNEGYLRRFDNEDFPTQQFYLDWDRRHSFLLTGGYGKEGSWSADIAAGYSTGAPFTHPRNLSRKPSRNNSRFPSTSNVDAEVHKFFMVFGVNADAFLRMTNVFDQRNVVNWDDMDQDLRNWLAVNPDDYLGPFRDYTVYGAPRNTVGGIRITF